MLALKKRKDVERWEKRGLPFRIFSASSLYLGARLIDEACRNIPTGLDSQDKLVL